MTPGTSIIFSADGFEKSQKEFEDDLSAYKGKWRNIGFFTTGVHYGLLRYSTQTEAKQRANEAEKEGAYGVRCESGRIFPWHNHLFTIQVPIGDE